MFVLMIHMCLSECLYVSVDVNIYVIVYLNACV